MAKRKPRLPNGELEALVMDVLWDHGGWLVPGDVVTALEPRHPLAYTTAMTILVRLWDKGMVERRRSGRAFAYHPVASREEWAAARMREFLETAGDGTAALSHFVAGLDRAQLGQLRRAVTPRRRT
jgi:predicted transcriptional regulator